jgi:hypothetical protein
MSKPSLSAAMDKLDTRAPSRLTAEPPAVTPAPRKEPRAAVSQPGRAGQEQVLGWFSKECKKQLKGMGVDQDKTQQVLLAEALNDLFIKYGKPTLA